MRIKRKTVVMMNNIMERAIKKIKESKSICIISHINPDGDNIGSTLALGISLLENTKSEVTIAKVDDIPKSFSFLPHINKFKAVDKDEKFDLLITLDCSDKDRLGQYRWIDDNCEFVINIDHHISNDMFGDINIVDHKASSTGEIVYKFLTSMDMKITKDVATCIYVAISTDTGSFKYDNTSSYTHKIAADLLEKEINLNEITKEIYQSRSLSKTNLLICSLNTLNLYNNNKIGIISITRDMLKNNNVNLQDSDGIIDFVRDIDSVEVACILKEINPLEIKVSLRSKKQIDVAKIAEKFKGGGHKRASGFTINKGIEDAEKQILDEILKSFR